MPNKIPWRPATLKRALSVAAVVSLTVLAFSVVAGALIESRGPGPDRLPQVSLSTPIEAGALVAEVTSPSGTSPSGTSAPSSTTTIMPVIVTAYRPPRNLSATGSRVTHPTPTATIARPVISERPTTTTTEHVSIPRPLVTAASPQTVVTTPKVRPGERTTTTRPEKSTTTLAESSTTTTLRHVFVPPTVREGDND